jgi:hypothetical protein
MRAGIATVVMLLLCALPAAALAAKPVPAWPSAHDLIQAEPGLRTADAACIARYYHGRLSRKAWFTLYYDLTDTQKIVTDAGPVHCMTLPERVAMDQRLYASVVGAHPQLHCVAAATEALSLKQRLAQTTRAKWLRAYDQLFRSCRLIGDLYASVGKEVHLALTPAERACANRLGSSDPVLHPAGAKVSPAQTRAVGMLFDHCVDAQSEAAMYRYFLRSFPLPSKIPCIARRAAANLTFVELLSSAPTVKTTVKKATTACLATS